MRWKKCLQIPVIILLLFLGMPAVSATDTGMPTPLITIPANSTSLADIAPGGTSIPRSALEPRTEITLLDLESNQTAFPGPRDMAFGPRSIRLATNQPILIILAAGTCLAVLAVIIYRKKKAADQVESSQDETETGK